MKKKMTILAVLVAAVAITTSQVAGTYAKYITSIKGTADTATVAKFKAEGTLAIDLFSSAYNKKDGPNEIMNSGSTAKIIGPGANGKIKLELGEEVTIDAQTNYKIRFDADVTNSNGLPVKFKLSGDDATDKDEHSIEDLGEILRSQLSSKVYNSKNAPASDLDLYIEWYWDFGEEGFEEGEVDKKDNTFKDGTATITATIKLTVAQTQDQVA